MIQSPSSSDVACVDVFSLAKTSGSIVLLSPLRLCCDFVSSFMWQSDRGRVSASLDVENSRRCVRLMKPEAVAPLCEVQS